jgi:hypothetical protein
VIVDVDVVVDGDGDGDVNEFPRKKPSHVAVAVKVNDNVYDNVNVYDHANRHFGTGISLASGRDDRGGFRGIRRGRRFARDDDRRGG